MSEDRDRAAVQRLLSLIARRIEGHLEGDEEALDSLGQTLEEGEYTEDQVQTVLLALRSLAGHAMMAGEDSSATSPGRSSQRVLSDHERESLSPEAWGYLLDLRRRGSLDSEQFECVLDRLATSGVRQVGVDLAHRMAVRVALSKAGPSVDERLGEKDVAH
jgi:uncharacterized protein Smg (DUF494 family)